MAQTVVKLGFKRDPKMLYYVKGGSLWQAPNKRAGGRGSKKPVVKLSLTPDSDYLYFLDAKGDISRARRRASAKKASRKSPARRPAARAKRPAKKASKRRQK